MNNKHVSLKLLAILLCLSFIGQAFAQVAKVGVSPGNVFKYKVTYLWSSTDPTATPPASWVEANSTDYYQATINEVTGTTVTLKTVQRFLNGTELKKDELIDVGNSLGGCLLLYAANLVGGSYLYPAATYLPWKVNATVSRPYGSGYRDTNWIEARMTDVKEYAYRYTSLYFDKATGVLVDAYFEDVPVDTPDQKFGRTIKITESSLWTVAGAPPGDGNGLTSGLPMEVVFGVVAVVAIVSVSAVALVIRKRGKKKPR